MKDLTARQKEVLALIQNHLNDSGMPPTRAEIARALNFRSANAAEEHLKALVKKGAIEIIPGASRGIRILSDPQPKGLPLVGRVAAGTPILAASHIESHFDVAANVFHPPADFLLRVQGESMKDIGIFDGDLLAVHQCSTVRNGQVAVVRVEDEVTVKRIEQKNASLILHAENQDFPPMKIDLTTTDVSIEGIAVGVLRNNAWM